MENDDLVYVTNAHTYRYRDVDIEMIELSNNTYRWTFEQPTFGGGSVSQTFDCATLHTAVEQACDYVDIALGIV